MPAASQNERRTLVQQNRASRTVAGRLTALRRVFNSRRYRASLHALGEARLQLTNQHRRNAQCFSGGRGRYRRSRCGSARAKPGRAVEGRQSARSCRAGRSTNSTTPGLAASDRRWSRLEGQNPLAGPTKTPAGPPVTSVEPAALPHGHSCSQIARFTAISTSSSGASPSISTTRGAGKHQRRIASIFGATARGCHSCAAAPPRANRHLEYEIGRSDPAGSYGDARAARAVAPRDRSMPQRGSVVEPEELILRITVQITTVPKLSAARVRARVLAAAQRDCGRAPPMFRRRRASPPPPPRSAVRSPRTARPVAALGGPAPAIGPNAASAAAAERPDPPCGRCSPSTFTPSQARHRATAVDFPEPSGSDEGDDPAAAGCRSLGRASGKPASDGRADPYHSRRQRRSPVSRHCRLQQRYGPGGFPRGQATSPFRIGGRRIPRATPAPGCPAASPTSRPRRHVGQLPSASYSDSSSPDVYRLPYSSRYGRAGRLERHSRYQQEIISTPDPGVHPSRSCTPLVEKAVSSPAAVPLGIFSPTAACEPVMQVHQGSRVSPTPDNPRYGCRARGTVRKSACSSAVARMRREACGARWSSSRSRSVSPIIPSSKCFALPMAVEDLLR